MLVKKLKKSGKYNNPEAKAIELEGKLIEEKTYEDILENCFEEALIYNNGKRKIQQE